MPKLTDPQLVVLSSATQRDDGIVVLPAKLKGGAAAKVGKPPLAHGLGQEGRAKPDRPVRRRDDNEGRGYALAIPQAGRRAINAEAERAAPGEEAPAKAARKGKGRQPMRPTVDANPRAGSKLALAVEMLGS